MINKIRRFAIHCAGCDIMNGISLFRGDKELRNRLLKSSVWQHTLKRKITQSEAIIHFENYYIQKIRRN